MSRTQDATVYLSFLAHINENSAQTFMDVCAQIMSKHQPETLYCSFSSYGGNIIAGITLYNFLCGLPTKIVMHNTGSVNSVANVIFLAGDEKYATPGSTFLFHGVTYSTQQATTFTRKQISEILSGLERDEERIQQIIHEKSLFSMEELHRLFDEGQTITPQYALEKGVIDEIRAFQVPKGALYRNIYPAQKT